MIYELNGKEFPKWTVMVQRQVEEVTQLLEVGDVEQSRWRLKEKALIQRYRAAKR